MPIRAPFDAHGWTGVLERRTAEPERVIAAYAAVLGRVGAVPRRSAAVHRLHASRARTWCGGARVAR